MAHDDGAPMRITRIHVAADLAEGMIIDLPPETAAHLAKVLRVRAGDGLVLFNGDGREFAGAVDGVQGPRVRVSVGAAAAADRESPLAVTLVQCVPRGDRMDFIVQKATELGVRRIVPVLSQRSVVRLDARQALSKAAHWRAVAVGACEQCGRNRLPSVDAPRPLLDYLGEAADDGEAVRDRLRLVLEPEAAPAVGVPGGGVDVAIGPEGGFADAELEAFRLAGFAAVALGPRILRTETAAIVALAWLQSRFGDLG
jgi:16S rRNA (uracil1498-N3)-methyltransferase